MNTRAALSTKSFCRERWFFQCIFLLFAHASAFLLAFTPGVRAQTTSVVEGTVLDPQGLSVGGAEIRAYSAALAIDRHATSDSSGGYRIVGLPAGAYAITVTKRGFLLESVNSLEVTVNRTITLNLALQVEGQVEKVEVSAVASLLETNTSSTGATIMPAQIEQMPINGRNYLDLLQLVPGVVVNRQQDSRLDSATPIMGERGGNAVFLIDGMPNRDEVNGGAAAQFNQ